MVQHESGPYSGASPWRRRIRLTRWLGRRAAVALLVLGACVGRQEAPLRLATTTSVRDSGLLDALLPAFKKRSGIDVSYVAVGTGIALDLGRKGEVDALITHDRAREEQFVAERHAQDRREFAISDFVIVGPLADPAGIRGLGAAEAFQQIAATGARFVSRGDSSGTHSRELALWKAAGIPHPTDSTYVEVRAGMQVTLQFASDRDAYTLTDRATYLAHHDRLEVEPLVQGDPPLENVYAVLVIDPAKHPEADVRRARRFADWLLTDEARRIIGGLERGGEPLFHVAPPQRETSRALPRAQELTVSAAISLKYALEALVPGFEEEHPGVEVSLNLGASGDLQRQIEAGAPVDVFVSAARRNMDQLVERGGVDPRTRLDIACNELVVAVPADAADVPSDLAQTAGLARIAIGNARTVPAGEYAREALEAAGLWERMQAALIPTENVRQALDYVARGEVEAGFVYHTDVNVAAEDVRVAFAVDPALYSPIVYPAAVVAGSRHRDLARRFVDYLTSEAGKVALRERGFTLPPCREARAG